MYVKLSFLNIMYSKSSSSNSRMMVNSLRSMSGAVSNSTVHFLDDYHGQLGVGFDKTAHPIPKVCSFNIVIRQVSCGEDHTAFVVEPSG